MSDSEVTGKIIGCAIDVHKALGPGLLENAYKKCLAYKLEKSGIYIEVEKPFPLIFEEVKLDCGYRADIYVANSIMVEIKSVDALNDVHMAQIITYMRLAKCQLGLLINFNVLRLADGIKRVTLKEQKV